MESLLMRPDIPIMSSNTNASNRAAVLEAIMKAKAKRIWLAVDRRTLFLKDRTEDMALVKENVDFFSQSGLEVGLWFQAFGFGDPAWDKEAKWTRLRSVTGKQNPAADTFCPEDPDFMAAYASWVKDLAATGARLLMLDDDLCMSVRPGIGCFCDRHLKLLAEELGEPVSLDNFKDLAFTGGQNRYRDAWYKVMGDSIRKFCRAVREAADEVDKTVRVGLCAGYTSWDIEGIDTKEMAEILAGNTEPFFRLTGAPYWVAPFPNRFPGQKLCSVIECARNQSAWLRDTGLDYFAEADSYPRPRYHINASLTEDFDIAMQAEGVSTLNYMVDYVSSLDYEPGYLKLHQRNMPLYDHIRRTFGAKKPAGVRLFRPMHQICRSNLPETFAGEDGIMRSYFSLAAAMLSGLGIPVTYDGESKNAALFGDDAQWDVPVDQFENVLLDLPAARILQSKGIDVGLESFTPMAAPNREWVNGERLLVNGLQLGALYRNIPGFYNIQVKDGAQVQGYYDVENAIASYVYQSGSTRFLVLAMDATAVGESSTIYASYARQKQLVEFFGNPYPVIHSEPDIYALCAEGEGKMAVLFENLSRDTAFDFYIDLPYPCDSFRLWGAEGQLTEDGKRIFVTSDFVPSAAIVLEIPQR